MFRTIVYVKKKNWTRYDMFESVCERIQLLPVWIIVYTKAINLLLKHFPLNLVPFQSIWNGLYTLYVFCILITLAVSNPDTSWLICVSLCHRYIHFSDIRENHYFRKYITAFCFTASSLTADIEQSNRVINRSSTFSHLKSTFQFSCYYKIQLFKKRVYLWMSLSQFCPFTVRLDVQSSQFNCKMSVIVSHTYKIEREREHIRE